DGEMIRAEASGWRGILTRMAPELALEEMAEHAIDFWLTTEDLPLTENRVELTRDGKVALHLKETNLEEHERLTEKLKSLLTQSGCKTELLRHALYMGQKIPIAGTAHQCGTIRFGADPKTSALDLNCRAHDLDNLYVVDGSFMVSSGAVNPSLTIMANALRVGEHLLKRTS
ncbi:MAG: GMC oxidoreductase, partial [Candidatus Eremiobacteraeota bacterium]|nr:GMC oxidoreductase [Candidatus Eremiobacteraeota bacterium]